MGLTQGINLVLGAALAAMFLFVNIRSDPETAADAIDEFIDYLRHNMDSLSQDRPIGFEKEPEHTRHCLDPQRLRFGDELQVEYDLGCTDFCLPALTLQPLKTPLPTASDAARAEQAS